MKKVFAILIAAVISFPHIVYAVEEKLKTEDIAGSFLLFLDVPDLCFEGEIVFINDNECTARFASGEEPTKLWIGSYVFDEQSLRLEIKMNKDNNNTLKCDIDMVIDLNTAKRNRVLEAVTTRDPDEKRNGTEIQYGSRVQITGFPREFQVPFRFCKNPREQSFFFEYDRKQKAK